MDGSRLTMVSNYTGIILFVYCSNNKGSVGLTVPVSKRAGTIFLLWGQCIKLFSEEIDAKSEIFVFMLNLPPNLTAPMSRK